MDFDDYDYDKEADKPEAPIGVDIILSAVVDTDDPEVAVDVADGVAEHIQESLDEEGIELHASATSDTFDPDQ